MPLRTVASRLQLGHRLAVGTKALDLRVIFRSDQDVETAHALRVDEYDSRFAGIIKKKIARRPTRAIKLYVRAFVVHRQCRCRSFRIWVRQLYCWMPRRVEEDLNTWCAIGLKQANDWVSRFCGHYDSGMALAIDNLNLIRDHR